MTLLHPKNLFFSVLKASFVSTIKIQPPTKNPLIHQTLRRFARSFSPCLGQGYCADYGYFDRFLGQDPSRGGCWSERMDYPLGGKRKIRWMILHEEYIKYEGLPLSMEWGSTKIGWFPFLNHQHDECSKVSSCGRSELPSVVVGIFGSWSYE